MKPARLHAFPSRLIVHEHLQSVVFFLNYLDKWAADQRFQDFALHADCFNIIRGTPYGSIACQAVLDIEREFHIVLRFNLHVVTQVTASILLVVIATLDRIPNEDVRSPFGGHGPCTYFARFGFFVCDEPIFAIGHYFQPS